MNYAIGIFSAAASVAATVMTQVVETWNQDDITQIGAKCQEVLTNSTCSWQTGAIISDSGIVSRCLYILTPTLCTLSGFLLTKNEKEEKVCGQPLIGAVPLALLTTATAVLIVTNYADPAAYDCGLTCAGRMFANLTSCEELKQSLWTYNVLGTEFLILSNLSWALVGSSLRSCFSQYHRNPQ